VGKVEESSAILSPLLEEIRNIIFKFYVLLSINFTRTPHRGVKSRQKLHGHEMLESFFPVSLMVMNRICR